MLSQIKTTLRAEQCSQGKSAAITRLWTRNRQVTDQEALLTVQLWFSKNSTIRLLRRLTGFRWITTCLDSLTTRRRPSEAPLMPRVPSSRGCPTPPRTSSGPASATGLPPRPASRTPWPDPISFSLPKLGLRVHTSLRLTLSPLDSKSLKWPLSVTTNLRISNQ